jgi:hypothetical protein
VSEFQQLFQPYPDGVNIAHVFALYSNRFKKEVFLHKIQEDLTSFAFFQRHNNVFCLWKRSDITVVGLAEHFRHQPKTSQLQTGSSSPQPDKGSLLGAIPKMQSPKNTFHLNARSPAPPKFQSPTTSVPIQFKSPTTATAMPSEAIHRATGHFVQTQWSASDIRKRMPGAKPMQTVTTEVSDSAENLARFTPQKLVPVSWHAPPRADDVLPATFGMDK